MGVNTFWGAAEKIPAKYGGKPLTTNTTNRPNNILFLVIIK